MPLASSDEQTFDIKSATYNRIDPSQTEGYLIGDERGPNFYSRVNLGLHSNMFIIRLAGNPRLKWEEARREERKKREPEERKKREPTLVGDEHQTGGGRDVFKIIDFDKKTGYFRLGGQASIFHKVVRVEDDKDDGYVVKMSSIKDEQTWMRIVDDNGKNFRLQPKFDQSLNFTCLSNQQVRLGNARCDGSEFIVEVSGENGEQWEE